MGRGCCYADSRRICTADVTKEIRSSFPRAAVFLSLALCLSLFISSHSLLHIFWVASFGVLDMWFLCWEYVIVVGLWAWEAEYLTMMMRIKCISSTFCSWIKRRTLNVVCCKSVGALLTQNNGSVWYLAVSAVFLWSRNMLAGLDC